MKPDTPLTADEHGCDHENDRDWLCKCGLRWPCPIEERDADIRILRTQLEQAQFEIQEAKDMHLAAQRGMRRAMAERTALKEALWHHHKADGLETDPEHCRLCQDAGLVSGEGSNQDDAEFSCPICEGGNGTPCNSHFGV
jgi:hypothetical protein